MEGDFRLMKRKPFWDAAVDQFLCAALGQIKEVPQTTIALTAFLADVLQLAEPDILPHSAAVVGWHPKDNTMLKVFFGTETAELQPGVSLRDKVAGAKMAKVMPLVWKVMRGADAYLSNAHGLESDSAVGRSICPLRTTAGNTFACLCSGPPSVPDELIQQLCKQAGPLLEHAWKVEAACEAAENVVNFLKKATSLDRKLVYAQFKKGKAKDMNRPGAHGDIWHWQPMIYASDDKTYEFPLRWRMGDPIGVFSVTCGAFTKMDEQLLLMLKVLSDVLDRAVDTIEDLTPGVDKPPLTTLDVVLSEYEERRKQQPKLMQQEIATQLKIFDAQKVFGEIRFLKSDVIEKDTMAMMQAVLLLLGHQKKQVKDWKQIQYILKNHGKLHDAMMAVTIGEETDNRWDESLLVTKGVDFELLTEHSTQAEVLLIRWLLAIRNAHNIALAIDHEAKPPPPNEIADDVFDQIDIDKNGTLDTKELVVYMVREFTPTCAHTLLRMLDVDGDKRISRDEWRRGWADGVMHKVLVREHEQMAAEAAEARKSQGCEDDEEARRMSMANRRMSKRREGGALAMTAQIASSMMTPEQQAKLLGEVVKKSGKKGGTPRPKSGKK